MDQLDINHLAAIVSALSILVTGGLWYSPLLFYRSWLEASLLTEDDMKNQNPLKVYGFSVILSLLMSYNMAFFLSDGETDWLWGLSAGFLTGFGWAAAIFVVVALFEQKGLKYILINSGFIIVHFTLTGLIIGAWR